MGELCGSGVSGPVAPFVEGFADELNRLGYKQLSVRDQLQLLAHVSRWLSGEDLQIADLHESGVVEAFVQARRAAGYCSHVSSTALSPLLEYLRQVGAVAAAPVGAGPVTAAEQVLERFRAYLLGERGMVVKAADRYVHSIQLFVDDMVGEAGVDPARVTTGAITVFMVSCSGRLAPKTVQYTASALRALLRFWHLDGVIPFGLSDAVPTVASRWPGLPRAASPAEVQALLDSCHPQIGTGPRCGRRDYAILLMLSRLGLRAGEVAALQLEDLNWRAGQITVRGKGNRRDLLPLPVQVGQAIAQYLREDRPAGALDRCVFIRVRAPQRGLNGTGITGVVASASTRAGLGTIHAHRLRHSAATQMLAAGAPLAEIGQVLRHQHPLTTAIYARVDTEALRTLARPWPMKETS